MFKITRSDECNYIDTYSKFRDKTVQLLPILSAKKKAPKFLGAFSIIISFCLLPFELRPVP